MRYGEFAWQILKRKTSTRSFVLGTRLFIVGLAKKLLIANTLAMPADAIFELAPSDLTAPIAWLGVICYTLQIYFDFSGYSDMAIGLGRMFGFKIPDNFNHPYTATSITDFWRRWHITLSRWFRDYLYFPLGGSRGSAFRTYFNLFTVFLLCGFWHGASWNFLLWGLLHGAYLSFERIGFGRVLARLPSPVAMAYTVSMVMLGWVFFQCRSVEHGFTYLSVMFGQTFGSRTFYELHDLCTYDVLMAFGVAVLASGGFFRTARQSLAGWLRGSMNRSKRRGRAAGLRFIGHALLLLLFIACCIRISADTYTPFLYFRF